jgi:exodeoxyribonuclease VII small subunit
MTDAGATARTDAGAAARTDAGAAAMVDTTSSQAIMFEPNGDLELHAGRVGSNPTDASLEAAGVQGKPSLREAAQTDNAQTRGTREQITFEQGYEELKEIVSRLDDPELPVHEMFEGFRRGKGLEKALRAYLQEREGELVELEEGNNLPEFEIAAL